MRGDDDGIILKLEFEKAFDSVYYNFLLNTLECLLFGLKWRMWIKALLDSIKTYILVNGSAKEEFIFNKGFRQGDPLSPLLFNIMGEVFSTLVIKAKNKELI